MKQLLLFICLGAVFYSFAQQDSDPIITDRPTQSAGAYVVPKGKAIIEYGFIYEGFDSQSVNVTWANFLARVGLLEGVELRVTQNIQQSGPSLSSDLNVTGASPTIVGTKVHLIAEEGAIPQMSFIGQVTLKNGKAEFRPAQAVPEVRLNFANSLSDYVSLAYNVGMSFPEGSDQTFYTAMVGYSFLPGWTAFFEPYGFFQDGQSDHRINTGVIFLTSNNFQLDLTGGIGLSDISPDYFIGFGAALGL